MKEKLILTLTGLLILFGTAIVNKDTEGLRGETCCDDGCNQNHS